MIFDKGDEVVAELRIPLNEQLELMSLLGDIAPDEGEPKLHAHVVIGRPDGTVRGGYLLEAHVWPTLEVILTESPRHLVRTLDRESNGQPRGRGASGNANPIPAAMSV